MPMTLAGSCRCGGVRFSVESHTPYPYQRCYCSICRKVGGAGYAINIMGLSDTLMIEGERAIEIFRAPIDGGIGPCKRHYCGDCATMLWVHDDAWPQLVHPFASCIDTDLPAAPERAHIMLGSRAGWVVPDIRPGDDTFDTYPRQSIADWHRSRGLWID